MTAQVLIVLMLLSGIQSDSGVENAIESYERGKFTEAANSFRKLADSFPSDPEIRIWLGRSYLKIREWDKAVREMETAVQLKPDSAQYHLWLGRACGSRASHTVFFKALGWARRVVKEFETARKLAPENLDVRFDLLEYYLEAPGIVGGGREKADAEVRSISKISAEKGYNARAVVFTKDKKWDLARKELEKAVLDYPRSASAHKDLASFLLDRNDLEGALDYARKALLLDSNSKKARIIEAAAKIRLKLDLDEEAEILRKFAAGALGDGDPSFEEVYYWLGECFLAKGDRIKARESFVSALAYDPEFDKAKDRLSRLR